MGYDIPNWRDAKDVTGLQAVDIFYRRYSHKRGSLHEDEEWERDW